MALINSGGDPYSTAVPRVRTGNPYGGGGYQPPSFNNGQPGYTQYPNATVPTVPGSGGSSPWYAGSPTETRGTQPYMPRTYPGVNTYPPPGTNGGYAGNYPGNWPGTGGYGQPQPGTAQPTPGMPSGIDPALAAIYKSAGYTPTGTGTGFGDWQYWQGVGPSQYARLAADIAGYGSDQPTGTTWAPGAWQGSGANAGTGTGASGGSFDMSGLLNAFTSMLQPLYSQMSQVSQPTQQPQQSSVLTNPAFWQSIQGLFSPPQQTSSPAPNFNYGTTYPGYGYGGYTQQPQNNPSQYLNTILGLLSQGG